MFNHKKNKKLYSIHIAGYDIDIKKLAIAVAILILLIAIIILLIRTAIGATLNHKEDNIASFSTASDIITEQEKENQRIDECIASYDNLGIVRVDGYLNIRENPDASSDVIGKLYDESACEVIESSEDGQWAHILSGKVDGYIHTDYLLTGAEAINEARSQVRLRAIVTTDKLNIRTEPNTESDVAYVALIDERYEVVDELDGWIQIKSGYMSSDYVELKYCLNEARKLDMKAMVLNMYNNLGISNVDNYINIREKPSEDGKIIGKFPGKAGCDILEEDNGWYKIKSGPVTGYVKAEYVLTGTPAKDVALANSSLMAIVTTDVLNARSEPNIDSKIWTQITNSERYPVISQSDGWVEIELEEDNDAYVLNDYVDVRYALNEAIKFSPDEIAAANASSRRQQIVNYALQFLGNPYVWGGTSLTKGADCSGFTMSVMAHFGISLPHYSGSQAKMGKAVSPSEMRPGDLIFYTNSSGTVNHVSMYIGNGQVVHAASRKSGIKISTWNYRKYKTIRNVLGD